MEQKTWIKFLKDHWIYAAIYFLAITCIILFYQLSSQAPVEIIYPLSIGIYGFLALAVIRGITYIGFQKRLKKSTHNPQYDMRPKTREQQTVNEVVNTIHHNYIRQLHTLQMENDAQSRFLSQWIHNLKTPIAVIDLMTQKSVAEVSEAKETLSSIAEENEKLHHSVDQLLSLIRLGNFTKDYIPERMNLSEELRQVINGMKNHFVIHHVFPELKLLTEDTTVFSDRKWHKLMLEQFISNAVKYSRKQNKAEEDSMERTTMSRGETDKAEKDSKGKTTKNWEETDKAEEDNKDKATKNGKEMDTAAKKVYITLEKQGDELCLTIRDEGIGIPEYDLDRIFEPFFTGDNGREIRNSTGIGLYLADVAGKKLGHRIEVKSAVGIGTTVAIHYKTSK